MTVDDVVVLNNIFARIKVVTLDTLLSCLQRLRHSTVLNWRFFVDTQPVHQRCDALPLENSHQIIFGRYVKLCLARVALTTAATAQLIVNPARLVALRADHHQAAQFLDALTEFNVGTASGDVCR